MSFSIPDSWALYSGPVTSQTSHCRMTSDDRDDINAGVASLRRALQSIDTARRAVDNIGDSYDKRDAEIALQHAADLAALAERLFSSAIGHECEARQNVLVGE